MFFTFNAKKVSSVIKKKKFCYRLKTEREQFLRQKSIKLHCTQWNCNNTNALCCVHWQSGKWGKTGKKLLVAVKC